MNRLLCLLGFHDWTNTRPDLTYVRQWCRIDGCHASRIRTQRW